MMPPSTSPAISGKPTPSAGGAIAWIALHAERVMLAAILLAIFARFVLIAWININWDEFYFLEFVHQYDRGELAGRFQTFHVHLFSWLPALGWSVPDQMVAGRFVMALLATGSAFLTYGIARRFVTRRGALFALLAYLSVSAVIEHGSSFRVDPIVTFLSLLALFAILCRPAGMRGAVLAGAAMALAMLVTVKSAFYLVVIAGMFWCLGQDLRARARLALPFAASFVLSAVALFAFHDAMLPVQEAAGTGDFLRSSATKVFFDSVFPRAFDLIWMLIPNPLFWLMLVQGAAIAWSVARKPENRSGWRAYLPLVLALPILTPTLYRNAFAYFYPFILAPAAVLVGLAFDRQRQGAAKPDGIPPAKLAAVLVLVQCGILLFGSVAKLGDGMRMQRETIAAVQSIFPKPVHYIDGFGVLADYPRTGFFMSGWGVENYRRAGQPVFAELVARDQPPFVLADSPSLYAALVPGVELDRDRTFLPEDMRFLKENYIPHWGMLFVAGKHLAGAGAVDFDIAVAGEYRLEAATPLVIDGDRLAPGSTVTLAAGAHAADFGAVAGEATLRWAQASSVPALPLADPLAFFHRKGWAGMTPSMMRSDAAR